MNALTISGLHKRYGTVEALAGIDIDCAAGSTTALLGPSGCGKTTLLRVVAGFERPDRGQIEIAGRTVVGGSQWVPPEHRAIGYVSQDGGLFPHLTVQQNIEYALPRAIRRKQQRLQELCRLVSLDTDQIRRFPHELSGGQQQRVALARALARRPRLVLLDEPFSALDASLRSATRDLVAGALAAENVTTILVTHDQEEALCFADTVVVMDAGRVRQEGSPDVVYSHPVDEWVACFVGEAVILEAQIADGLAVCALGAVPVAGGPERRFGRILIRPEQLRLQPFRTDPLEKTPSTAAGPGPVGTVTAVSYRGHDQLVTLLVADAPILITGRTPGGGERFHPGMEVSLQVQGSAVVFPDAGLV